MATLRNFPMKNQLGEATADGRPPENANYDCVPTSIAAGVQFLTGKTVHGDDLKDLVYGEGWVNKGTAPADYAGVLAKRYGVTMKAHNGAPYTLVAAIHAGLRAGHPVIVTMPSQWGTVFPVTQRANPPFSTHVGIAYADDGGVITVMNPWGGFAHKGNDAYWADRLCFNQVWELSKVSNGGPTITMLEVKDTGTHFKDVGGGRWHCVTTNCDVMGGILNFYRSINYPLNGYGVLGLPLSGEMGNVIAGYAGTIQPFERGALAYDPEHKFDGPPGAGDVYFMHVEQGSAFDFYTRGLRGQLDDARKAANDASAKAAQAATDAAAAKANTAKAQADATAARAQLDAVNTQLSAAQDALKTALSDAADKGKALDAANANLKAAQDRIAQLEAGAGSLTAEQAAKLAALDGWYKALDALMAARGNSSSQAAK